MYPQAHLPSLAALGHGRLHGPGAVYEEERSLSSSPTSCETYVCGSPVRLTSVSPMDLRAIIAQGQVRVPVASPTTTPQSLANKKRKWSQVESALARKPAAPSFNLNFILNDKEEMEQHALILASLAHHFEQTEEKSTSTEEDLEELHSTHGSSKKRFRTTPHQLQVLEKTYEADKMPSLALREDLAQKLGMTPRRVQVWFQNKRAKERRNTKSTSSSNPPSGQEEAKGDSNESPSASKLSVFAIQNFQNECASEGPLGVGEEKNSNTFPFSK